MFSNKTPSLPNPPILLSSKGGGGKVGVLVVLTSFANGCMKSMCLICLQPNTCDKDYDDDYFFHKLLFYQSESGLAISMPAAISGFCTVLMVKKLIPLAKNGKMQSANCSLQTIFSNGKIVEARFNSVNHHV
jgi:hypothetical protein